MPEKQRHVHTAIVVDPMGVSAVTPEQEIKEHVKHYSGVFKPLKLDWYRAHSAYPGDIKEGTDLILFDYGGMTLGNDMLGCNSRELVKWASDHPTSLVVVVSAFTYQNGVQNELQDQGFNELPNVVCDHGQEEDVIPQWFRDQFKLQPVKPHRLVPPTNSPDLYYIQDTRQVVGNCALWWRKDGQGYTCNLDEAWKIDPAVYGDPCRDTDVFRLCSKVDALALRHVHVEQLPKKRRVKHAPHKEAATTNQPTGN